MQAQRLKYARCPYYFALYGTAGILIRKLLFAFYTLSNYIQSKAIMWQASIYMGKLFKFNHCFAWKSMWQVVFELCSSEIKITYKCNGKLVFIGQTTWIKATYKLLQARTSYLNLNRRCKVFTWCQECWCIFTEWHFSAFYQVGEVDSVLQLIFLRNVNFLQVYNKLDVSRTFNKFFRNFYFFVWLLDKYWAVLNQLSEKFNSQEVFPEFPAFFKLFPSLLQDCTVFPQVTLRFGLFRVLGGGTFQNFVYFGISADIQLYALQLVYSLLK